MPFENWISVTELGNSVLKNINVSIASGEKVAFVGESGSGKTTLIKLLMNFYTAEKGEILFNGNNIKDIHMEIYGIKSPTSLKIISSLAERFVKTYA